MLDQLPKPAVIGHRGASKYAPENTIAAFSLAAEQGADGVELDAKLSADGEVVVIHDATVNRTTNGTGRVDRLSLEELRELDAGSWFSPDFAGETIPTLAEVLEIIAPQIRINIELTNYYGHPFDDLPIKAAGLIREYGVEERVWISSFSLVTLWRFARLLPDVPVGILTLPGISVGDFRKVFHNLIPHAAIHPNRRDIQPALIQKYHAAGKKIYGWTVNDPDKLRELADMQIDGLITDDPLTALQITRGGEI